MNPIDSLIQQFKTYLARDKCRLDVLSILAVGLSKKRNVNFTQLATTFPGTTKTSSCYRRIQNFFAEVTFDEDVVARLVADLFGPEGKWFLSMDRTNWMGESLKLTTFSGLAGHEMQYSIEIHPAMLGNGHPQV